MTHKTFTQVSVLILMLLTFFIFPISAHAGGCGSTYTVQPGDTLGSVANGCGITVYELYTANPGISGYLYTGQVLTIPDSDYYNNQNDNGSYNSSTPTITIMRRAIVLRVIPTVPRTATTVITPTITIMRRAIVLRVIPTVLRTVTMVITPTITIMRRAIVLRTITTALQAITTVRQAIVLREPTLSSMATHSVILPTASG